MEIEYIPLSWALTVHDIVLKECCSFNIFNCNVSCFSDGNKRTALAIGVYFLTINGYTECHDKFYRDMEALLLMLAEKRISKEQ